MTGEKAFTSKKEIPTFSGRLYTYEHERGLAGQWVRRAEVDVLIDEIERLEAKWRAEGDAYIDAKDEIERLRAALEECYSIWSHYQGDHPAYVDQMADIINREISGDSPGVKPALKDHSARERIWIWYEGYNAVRVAYTKPSEDKFSAIEYVRVSDDSYAPTQLRLGDEPWPEDSSVETSPHLSSAELLIPATRYYIGRMTIHTTVHAQALARGWHSIPQNVRNVIRTDLEDAFRRDDAMRGDPVCSSSYYPLGGDVDREAWEEVRKAWLSEPSAVETKPEPVCMTPVACTCHVIWPCPIHGPAPNGKAKP